MSMNAWRTASTTTLSRCSWHARTCRNCADGGSLATSDMVAALSIRGVLASCLQVFLMLFCKIVHSQGLLLISFPNAYTWPTQSFCLLALHILTHSLRTNLKRIILLLIFDTMEGSGVVEAQSAMLYQTLLKLLIGRQVIVNSLPITSTTYLD